MQLLTLIILSYIFHHVPTHTHIHTSHESDNENLNCHTIVIWIYLSCTSSSPSPSKLLILLHTLLQCPHLVEHSNPCFLHVHRYVLQAALQLHRTISSMSVGVGSLSIMLGMKYPPWPYHPQSSGFMWSHPLLNLEIDT